MNYRTVSLTEYPYQPITDFSRARNYFLNELEDDEYILFVEHDEEASRMLLHFLEHLKPVYPYYAIRIFTYSMGRYVPLWGVYEGRLASNRVHYEGHPDDHAYPRKPYGRIDLPIIHNQIPHKDYGHPWWTQTMAGKAWIVMRKLLDDLREKDNLVYGHVGR